MKTLPASLLFVLIFCCTIMSAVSFASAQSIGIQFQGTGTALLSTDSAGLSSVANTNWNVATGSSFSSLGLSDSTGTSTTATLSGKSLGTYNGGGSTASPAGNAKLASGELFNASFASSPTMTVANIPYSNYDVYVYAGMDASGRSETVSVAPSNGATQYYSFTTEGGGSAWTVATSTWNGSGTAPSLPVANYVHVAGLTASSFTMAFGTYSNNGSINGIQIVPNGAPVITTQPANQTVTVGQTATFSVMATGSGALSYQWRKNGNPISGATSATYTTPATASSDNGSVFSAVVTNSSGNATSSGATLTVNTSASTAAIGIQFQGTGTALLSTDSAGLSTVAQTNWNVITGSSFSGQALSNATGAATTATLGGSALGTYNGGGSTASPAGNAKLASGELWNGGYSGSPSISVSNIPFSSYDVYIYAGMDAPNRSETVSLTPSGGSVQYFSFTTEGGGSAWTAATSTWNGTGTAPSLPVANYVHFSGLTATSFSTIFGASGNGSINGIQIVPTGSTSTYALTVNSGTGSGNYTAGTQVTVSANAPQSGYQFAGWTGATSALSNPSASTTVLTMPAAATSITATYSSTSGTTYALTVNSGTGSGSYTAGTQVNVTANTPQSGYQFSGWTGATSALANPSAATTVLTMPAAATSITANYSSTSGTLNNLPTVFIGDSITNNYGWKEYLNTQFGGIMLYQPGASGYNAGAPGYNKGVSGNTTTDMLNRFTADVVNQHPSIVFIMGGTNDNSSDPTTSINNLSAMYTAAINGGVSLVVALGETQAYPTRSNLTTINNWIMTQASSKILPIRLDQISTWQPNASLPNPDTSDNLHPNWSGAQKIVATILPALINSGYFNTSQTVFSLNRTNLIPAFTGTTTVTGQNVSGTIYNNWNVQTYSSTGPTVVSSLGTLSDGSPAIVLNITPGSSQDAIHLTTTNIPFNGAVGAKFDFVAQVEMTNSGPEYIGSNIYPLTSVYYILGSAVATDMLPANNSFTIRIPAAPQTATSGSSGIDFPITMSTMASGPCTIKIGKIGAFTLP